MYILNKESQQRPMEWQELCVQISGRMEHQEPQTQSSQMF